MLTYADVCWRMLTYGSHTSKLQMRAAKEKRTTHLLVCGSDPPSLLEIPSPPSQNLSSAGRPHVSSRCWWCVGVCVCVCDCVRACVREQAAYVRAHVSVCNSFYLFIVLGGLNTFLRTIAATSPRFRVRLVGCAGCGLAGSFSHGTCTDDELCCMATSEQIPRASLRPCTTAVNQHSLFSVANVPV